MAITMTPEPFILDNTGAPPARKDNPELFRPPNKSQVARQSIYRVLASKPTETLSLAILAQLTGLSSKEVYAACRFLCLKGFLTRIDDMQTVTTDPTKPKYKRVISVRYNEPWGPKKKVTW